MLLNGLANEARVTSCARLRVRVCACAFERVLVCACARMRVCTFARVCVCACVRLRVQVIVCVSDRMCVGVYAWARVFARGYMCSTQADVTRASAFCARICVWSMGACALCSLSREWMCARYAKVFMRYMSEWRYASDYTLYE